jgi:NAD-dependent dihydropyrimidine dehydrogenase PreA subunit
MWRKLLLAGLAALFLLTAEAAVPKQTADSIANLLNRREVTCDKSCPLFSSESGASGIVNTLFIDVLAVIGTVWLYSSYRRKYFFLIGGAVVVIVTGSLLWRSPAKCVEYKQSTCQLVRQDAASKGGKAASAAAAPAGDLSDFEQMDSASLSDFSTVDATASGTADFSSVDVLPTVSEPAASAIGLTSPKVLDPILIFVFLAAIGFLMRYRTVIRFRGLFLLLGVVWLGFYRGGCSCMISSFEDLVLGLSGWHWQWASLLWIAVLLVATYLFGRVWCGWLCHLGGLQELLYRSPKLKVLSTDRSQRVLRVVRYAVFGVWVLQLLLTRTNLFCRYDPFKSIFNMLFADWTGIALAIVLLVTSVLIYRPFCRMLCPVGVLLGWVQKLPGARSISVGEGCVGCGLCVKECPSHALSKSGRRVSVDKESCLSCGECTTVCKKQTIKMNRR